MRTIREIPDDHLDIYDFGIEQHTELDPRSSHRHNNVEIAYTNTGSMTCIMGGKRILVPCRRFAVFWGALPHRWLDATEGATCSFINLPLSWFVQWGLPAPFIQRILHGDILFEQSGAPEAADALHIQQWAEDLGGGKPGLRQVIMLELQARLWRLAMNVMEAEELESVPDVEVRNHGDFLKTAAMVRYIAEHYQEPLTVLEIAHAADLHPNYTMTLFHSRTGVTVMDYVMQQRISHAQLLLSTTDTRVVDVAFHSGFGSASRFYSAFKRACGKTPNEYRHELRGRT